MAQNTRNGTEQWLSEAYYSQTKEKTHNKQDTCYSNTVPTATKQRMDHLHIPRPLHTQYHQSIQKNWFENSFPPTNTIFQQLTKKPKNNNPSGIYQLECSSCSRAYVGQSGEAETVRHKEHLQYIRNNNPMSAYAIHILHNRHEFGLAENTLKLLKPCNKGTKMNCWEALYTNMHHKQGLLIPEQQVTDTNPFFDLAIIPHHLQTTSLHSSFSLTQRVYTHTHTNTHTPG